MRDQKGVWKHDWEPRGEPIQTPRPNGRTGYDRVYVCRVCGTEIRARCSSRVRTSAWKKLGIKECVEALVDAVHDR